MTDFAVRIVKMVDSLPSGIAGNAIATKTRLNADEIVKSNK